jgi:hypothetical protein
MNAKEFGLISVFSGDVFHVRKLLKTLKDTNPKTMVF